ncbi:MAG TPA: EamA family transporter [Desulfocapsa sulfexigens]|nr:EamA family transporter [Desulfocapsa sulfexigens]
MVYLENEKRQSRGEGLLLYTHKTISYFSAEMTDHNRKKSQSTKKYGEFLVLLAAILWGTTGTAQAFANPAAQPVVIGICRVLIAGLVLSIPVLLRGNLMKLFQPFGLVLLAAVSSLMYQVTFFSAVHITGVAIGTIVGIGSSPIFAGILGWLIRKERPGWRWWPATILAIGGTFLVALSSSTGSVAISGILLALASGFSYAVLAVAMKNILQLRNDPLSVTCGVFLLGGCITLPVLFFFEISWMKHPDGIGVLLYLGIITAALAYYLFTSGLRYVKVATAGTLTMAEPMTAGILGVVILGERLSTSGWWGIALLISGLIILAFPARTVRALFPAHSKNT